MDLLPLFTLTGTAVTEQLGKVQDGERIKIEFRGKSAAESGVAGKAHGTSWILIGPFGPGETSAVHEIITAAGERLVVELRGYARQSNGTGLEIRTAGIIRSSAAAFAHLNGHVAVVVQRVQADDRSEIHAYAF